MGKVSIDKYIIDALVMKRHLLGPFPFLTKVITTPGCCGRKGKQPDYDYIKQVIATMPGDRQAAFKQALRASQVTVFLPGGREVSF